MLDEEVFKKDKHLIGELFSYPTILESEIAILIDIKEDNRFPYKMYFFDSNKFDSYSTLYYFDRL